MAEVPVMHLGDLIELAYYHEIPGARPPAVRHYGHFTRIVFSPEEVDIIAKYGYLDLPPIPCNEFIANLQQRGH